MTIVTIEVTRSRSELWKYYERKTKDDLSRRIRDILPFAERGGFEKPNNYDAIQQGSCRKWRMTDLLVWMHDHLPEDN